MTDTPDPTFRLTVRVPHHDQDAVSAWLFTAGALGITTDKDTLTCWFAAPRFAPTALAVPASLAHVSEDQFLPEPHRDWHAAWVDTITAVTVGPFLITPQWLVDITPLPDDMIRLIVDPAQAFGSGHHATTAMCLELLHESSGQFPDWQVADVGCGTGVLAIAAAKLGATVEAVDTDAVAVRVTEKNAVINGVTLTTAVGSVDALSTRAHTLVANLLSDTIISLAEELATAPTKELIVSGIAREHFPRVEQALKPFTGSAATVAHRDGWVAARFHTDATR